MAGGHPSKEEETSNGVFDRSAPSNFNPLRSPGSWEGGLFTARSASLSAFFMRTALQLPTWSLPPPLFAILLIPCPFRCVLPQSWKTRKRFQGEILQEGEGQHGRGKEQAEGFRSGGKRIEENFMERRVHQAASCCFFYSGWAGDADGSQNKHSFFAEGLSKPRRQTRQPRGEKHSGAF